MALANLIADLGSLGLLRPYFIRGQYDPEKSKNDYFLDVIKFNLIKLNYLNDFISLGGIDSSNIRREKMCKSAGVASISWVKKNGPSINTGPF